jgi:lipid-binding SYLF domain-containing protein
MLRITTLGLAWICSASLATAAPTARETLTEAQKVLAELTEKNRAIPAKLLDQAEAVVIVPNTIKAGLGVGGQIGFGVAVIKDKAGGWGDIRFVDLGGASVGFQVGVQSTDVVLVFKNRKGLDRLLDGKAKLKLGADASVAAGPVGRDAAVATDLLLKSEIFSYSRAKGLFAGVSLEGVILNGNTKKTEEFEKDAGAQTKAAAEELKKQIAMLSVGGDPKKEQPLPGPMSQPMPLQVLPGAAPLPPATVPSEPAPAGMFPIPAPVIAPAPTTPAESTGPVRRFFRWLFR